MLSTALVLTCHMYIARRLAVEATWATDWRTANPGPLIYMISPGPADKPYYDKDTNLLHIDAPNNYYGNALRFHKTLEWLRAGINPDHVFCCDDDSYVVVDRLLKLDCAPFDYVGQFCKGQDGAYDPYASGGAGFILSRKAIDTILADPVWFTDIAHSLLRGFIDMLIGRSLRSGGIEFIPNGKFYSQNNMRPLASNELITCHYVPGDEMIKTHKAYLASLTVP